MGQGLGAMNEIIAKEVNQLKQELARNILELGRALIGEHATLKQISNLVGPQFGLSPGDCLDILLSAKQGGGVNE